MFRPFDLLFWIYRFRFWQRGVRHHTFPLNDASIHYWEGGSGSPLLLVHGLGGSVAQDFNSLLPALAQKFHVIAPDLPGFGLSHDVSFTQSIATQSEFLLSFL